VVSRRGIGCAALLLSVAVSVAAQGVGASEGSDPALTLDLAPTEVTVGEPIVATLTVTLPAGTALEPPVLGPELGPFSVTGAAWSGPESTEGGGLRWVWQATLSAYKTGELEVPAIRLSIDGVEGVTSLATEQQSVEIVSVLESAEDSELADLKPAASVAPDFGPLRMAAWVLALLLLGSLLAWWLHRRYGAKLAAAEAPTDPFHRTPPHVWVYGELQQLLERRLPEQGQIDLFYSELSRILKQYLGGRYRLDLMEHTSAETPSLLQQAGAPPAAIEATAGCLQNCDAVKFARGPAGPPEWKAGVESVYRVVDMTKPVEREQPGRADRRSA